MDIGSDVLAIAKSFGTALAGLAGGVARVMFIGQSSTLSGKRAIGLILLGMLCAGYLTPLFGLVVTVPPDGAVERALGFAIGLLSMTLIEGALKLADWLREDPTRFLDLLRRRPPTGGA